MQQKPELGARTTLEEGGRRELRLGGKGARQESAQHPGPGEEEGAPKGQK